ncbi:MAG TPA: MarR family transcriptional regulator [Solirubrobacteraceae bacterium]|nr:MarR family transcriptional regulator [Solirubrobacteraceae bacterium]
MPVECGAEDKALAAELYALITHLHKNCNPDLLEAVGTLELSLSQIKLLHHLDQAAAALTLKQGAEAVHVSLPAASRLVEDLVNRGLIERNEDVTDRRMKRIALTDRGRDAIARLNAARLTGVENFVATLGASERRSLAQLLSKLMAREEIAAALPPSEFSS